MFTTIWYEIGRYSMAGYSVRHWKFDSFIYSFILLNETHKTIFQWKWTSNKHPLFWLISYNQNNN